MESRDPEMTAFLRQAARTPFVWGETDCSLFMSDWVKVARGIDPAASLRGRYRTALGAARHIRRLGGIEPMGRALAAAAGLSATEHPLPRDIGLVRDPVAGPLFAVLSPLGWVAKAQRGIAVGPFPVIVAWTI